jgi:hypothetical protein
MNFNNFLTVSIFDFKTKIKILALTQEHVLTIFTGLLQLVGFLFSCSNHRKKRYCVVVK